MPAADPPAPSPPRELGPHARLRIAAAPSPLSSKMLGLSSSVFLPAGGSSPHAATTSPHRPRPPAATSPAAGAPAAADLDSRTRGRRAPNSERTTESPASKPWWDGFGKAAARCPRSGWSRAPRRLTASQFGGVRLPQPPGRRPQPPQSNGSPRSPAGDTTERNAPGSGGQHTHRAMVPRAPAPGPGSYEADSACLSPRGGFIAPPQTLVPRRGAAPPGARPGALGSSKLGVMLVHTTGGVDNPHNTCLHTPGPGNYDVSLNWTGEPQGAFLKGSRQIETHCGYVDLFREWHAPGPGSYFQRMDEAGFAGRDRTMRKQMHLTGAHTARR
eukprot:TRINITY_DN13438_c3_g1_i1.p2 TRINITY_DN13438_c3_g1~~TRINITY_DN13438_c3_g1_i1.p2  ORF type:complete len:364 (+),score=59.76 TRINITY_DN13438_c3_g1_i1:107-1093(+)